MPAGCSYLVLHSLGEGNSDAELFIWNGCSIPKARHAQSKSSCSSQITYSRSHL